VLSSQGEDQTVPVRHIRTGRKAESLKSQSTASETVCDNKHVTSIKLQRWPMLELTGTIVGKLPDTSGG